MLHVLSSCAAVWCRFIKAPHTHDLPSFDVTLVCVCVCVCKMCVYVCVCVCVCVCLYRVERGDSDFKLPNKKRAFAVETFLRI